MTTVVVHILLVLLALSAVPVFSYNPLERHEGSQILKENGYGKLAVHQDTARRDAPELVLLQRCLADPTCSQALSSVAVDLAQAAVDPFADAADRSGTLQSPSVSGASSLYSLAATAADPDGELTVSDRADELPQVRRADTQIRSPSSTSPHNSHTATAADVNIPANDSLPFGFVRQDSPDGFLQGIETDREPMSLSLKGAAALALFLEAVAGMYLPLLLRRLESPQWWLSLLNCFSGGIFVAAGIIHLLPHCAEAQEALGPIGPNGDYPLYLVLVVVGYCVVFYVERVLFDVHGEGHWHCQHSNVFSHSSYYKAMSHRSQRAGRVPSVAAAANGDAAHALPAGFHARALPDGAVSLPHSPRHAYLVPPGAGLDAGKGGANGGSCGGGVAVMDVESGRGCEGHPKHNHGHYHSRMGAAGSKEGGPLYAAADFIAGSADRSTLAGTATADEDSAAAAAGVTTGGEGLLGGGSVPGLRGAGGDDDGDSCHSDHTPLAVCVCVDEVEPSGPPSRRASGSSGRSGHRRRHRSRSRSRGRRRYSYEHPGGQLGTDGDAALRTPLLGSSCCADGSGGSADRGGRSLLADATHADAGATVAGPAVLPPLPAFPPQSEGVDSASGDLRSQAWQHLHQQHLHHLHLQQITTKQGQPPHLLGKEAEEGSSSGCRHHPHQHPHLHHHTHDNTRQQHQQQSAGGGSGSESSSSSPPLPPLAGTAPWVMPHTLTHPHGHGHNHHNHSHGHNHHQHHNHHNHHHVIKPRFRFMHGVVLLVALALHTALECIALGLVDERGQFSVLFLAIASHKAVSALALSSRFLKEGATMTQVTAYVGPFCLVAPLSILLGIYVGRVAPLARLVFSCFATGTFLYVGASEVIMEEFEGEMRADRRDISTRAARYIKFGAVLLAVGLVAASGLLPDADH